MLKLSQSASNIAYFSGFIAESNPNYNRAKEAHKNENIMIRIDENFVFEQTGENRFHLVRETYPRYAEEVIIDININSNYPAHKIKSYFIEEESKEVDKAENKYGRDCFVEIMEGASAEHKILYALEHNKIEELSNSNEEEQRKYFDGLVITHEKGKGLFAMPQIF